MAYEKFPGNQQVGPVVVSGAIAPQDKVRIPHAKVQAKLVDTAAIGDGFRKMGNNIVQEQLPGFIHRLLYSIVDALLPGGTPTPYIGRSNYSGYTGVLPGGRMAQMPQYGTRTGLGYSGVPVSGLDQPMANRRAFDKFLFLSKEEALDTCRVLLEEASQLGYITVSKAYDIIGLPCSPMAQNYYWTVEELSVGAAITETPTGECKVSMPKAHIIS